MFQVKFLKPVTLSRSKAFPSSRKQKPKPSDPFFTLSSTLTISNDLGEQFYHGEASINVAVRVQPTNDVTLFPKSREIGSASFKWAAGQRAVGVEIDTLWKDTPIGSYVSLHISVEDAVDGMNFDDITTKALIRDTLDESKPLFKDCKVTKIHKLEKTYFYESFSELLQIPNVDQLPVKTERNAIRPMGSIQLYEELSGSIARHLWDAGIYVDEMPLGSFLDFISTESQKVMANDPLNILELGTGIGLVSIHLGKLFPKSRIIATDLEDAQETCEKNITLNNTFNVSFGELDWESETPTGEKWDLIVVTDCTYNPLYYDALITVLKTEYTEDTRILLAHKFREPVSEVEFFDRMESNGFILDKQLWVHSQAQSLVHLGFYRRGFR